MNFDPNNDMEQEQESPLFPDILNNENEMNDTSSPLPAAEEEPETVEETAAQQDEPAAPLETAQSEWDNPETDDFYNAASEPNESLIPNHTPEKAAEEEQNDSSQEESELAKYMAEFSQELPPEPPKPPRKKKRPVKKGRPRKKNGEGLFGIPNILVTVVWCALTLLISLTLGRLVWVCAAEVLAFGREDKTVTVTIFETDTIDDITKKLARSELIHYPGLFKLYASFAVDEGEIKPGMWDLNTKYDYHALVSMMSPSSTRDVVQVTIPEGYTCRQIFSLLEDNKVCTVKDIESYAANGELDAYWFLEGVTRGDKYCLEGFLFPDTYEFYQNDTPKNVLHRMLNNFNNRFDEDMQWKIQTLNAHLTDLMRRNGHGQDYINSHQFTAKDVVNVASMIEKETSSAQEGYTIASVIYNRLFCWGNTPPYLNIDATIVYALGGKTDLTYEDLRVDSPYNTYTNLGLTPGPISNPGLSSLKAALEPSDTNYYFYVLDPSVGSHHFSTTEAEHEAFRASLGG